MDQRFSAIRAAVAPPVLASRQAAGWDLRAAVHVHVEPENWTLVPTGYRVHLAAHEVGLVCPRSGLALHEGLTVLNAPGVIDPDFDGEVGVILYSHNAYPVHLSAGDRIAQLLILPRAVAGHAAAGERRAGGFGSTGR